MDRRRRDLEVTLHVGFSRGNAVDFGVVVDESEVLPLAFGVGLVHARIVHGHCLSVNVSVVWTASGQIGKTAISIPAMLQSKVSISGLLNFVV